MKLQIIISIFCLCFFSANSGFSQAVNPENKPDIDPKLNLNEQLAILEASKGTPAKVEVTTDPKMIEEYGFDIVKETGPTDYNAKPAVVREPVFATPTTVPSETIGNSSQTQPEPDKPESVINYRKMNNNGQQPLPEKNSNVINYRKISGPQEQPDGKPDNK